MAPRECDRTTAEYGARSVAPLSPGLMARWRLAEMGDTERGQYQGHFESLLRRIHPDYDPARDPIEFVLVDEASINAFYDFQEGKHVIGLSKGLLQDAGSLDLIAFVLAHEYNHYLVRQKHGEIPNSKLEELLSDLTPLRALEKAGFDTTVALEFFISLAGKRTPRFALDAIDRITDPHPDAVNRKSLLEAALTKLSSELGGLHEQRGKPRTTVPSALVELAAPLKARSAPVASQAGEVSSRDHEKKIAQIPEQIRELAARGDASEIKRFLKDLLEDVRFRARQVSKRAADAEVPGLLAIVDSLVEHCEKLWPPSGNGNRNRRRRIVERAASSDARFADIYGQIATAIHGSSRAPVGREFEAAREHARALATASTVEQARGHAEALLRFSERNRAALDEFANSGDYLAISPFKLDTLAHALKAERYPKHPVPWNALVSLAREDTTGAVRQALVLLGIYDRRIVSLMSGREIVHAANRGVIAESQSVRRYRSNETDTGIFSLSIDDEGHITGARELHLGSRYEENTQELLDAGGPRVLRYADRLFGKAAGGDRGAVRFLRRHGIFVLGFREREQVIGLEHAQLLPKLFLAVNKTAFRGEFGAENFAELLGHLESLLESESNPGTKERVRQIILQYVVRFNLDEAKRDFFEFVLQDRFRLFTAEEKFRFFDFAKIPPPVEARDARDYARLRKELGIDPSDATTGAELRRRLEKIDALRRSAYPQGVPPNLFAKELKERSDLLETMKVVEIERYLDGRTAELALEEWMDTVSPAAFRNHEPLRRKLVPLIEEYEHWPENSSRLLTLLKRLGEAKLLRPDSTLADELIARGTSALEKDPSPDHRLAQVEETFGSEGAQWPQIRSRLESIWTRAVREIADRERDPVAHRGKVLELVDTVAKKLDRKHRSRLFEKLAEELESQNELSQALRARVEALGTDDFHAGQQFGGMAEVFALLGRRDAPFRSTMLDFLMSNPSAETTDRVLRSMERAVARHTDLSVRLADFGRFRRLPATLQARYLEILHANFWSGSLPERAVIVKELLFPHMADAGMRRGLFENNREWVFHQLFPPGEPYGSESAALLRKYTDLLSEFERPLFVAAAMTAAEKLRGRPGVTIGQRLASVLELMGPAYIKLGQAIHSFEGTPKEIREGMVLMKQDIEIPTRWDLFDHFRVTVPEAVRNRIKRVGRRLGAASYYYVYEVEMTDGKVRAMALLKPDARQRSEFGFTRMLRLIEALRGDPSMRGFVDSLGDLVSQAKEMAKIETDSEMAKRQSEHARLLYSGRRVVVDGETFDFSPALTVEAGEGYRLMDLAKGSHYNDLPVKTAAQRAHKKKLGLAYHSLELAHILSGRPFDEDRHGGQMRVTGNTAALYDFGAMRLEPAHPEELRHLGRLLHRMKKALEDSASEDLGGDLNKMFLAEIEEYQRSGRASTGYLLRVHKAWLALSDFRAELGKEDYRAMFDAVVSSSVVPVSPEILNGYKSQMSGSETAGALWAMVGFGRRDGRIALQK